MRRGGQFGFCVWNVSIVNNVTEQLVNKQLVISQIVTELCSLGDDQLIMKS